RTEYFHTLFEPDILNQEASIVIIKDDQLIGFSYVLEFEENSRHISCMCIHPDFQGKGLGKLLLYKMIDVISKQGAKYITLGTEIDMRAFHLYKNNGFNIAKGTIILRWE
ncbi:MAG: GNAT family N-acetyltransferase, partial [Promethearchaeota archaeon]